MKKKIEKIQIILPPTASSELDMDLVAITEYLAKKFDLDTSFGLGGEFGYGVEFENDVFMMHPYCWCEEEKCGWCNGNKPNFLHKKSKFKIHWYKWIGRDMEYRKIKPQEWKKIFDECLKSVQESKPEDKKRGL